MADSPSKDADGPVSVTVKVDGSAIADDYQVMRLQVDHGLGRIPEATVMLLTGSIAMNEFPASDTDDFKIGKAISLAAAYGGGSDHELFSGLIISKRMRVVRGAPRLEIACIDKAAKLTYTRKSALYTEKKDSDVMSEILKDAQLEADVAATTDQARDILRYGCTDWGYLRSIADRSGYVVTVSAGKVTVRAPGTDSAPVLTVTLGVDLISFDARIGADATLAGARAAAWDATAQKTVAQTGKDPGSIGWGTYKPGDLAKVLGDREYVASTAGDIPAAELKTGVDARTLRSDLATIQGLCVFQGSVLAEPGAVLELKGLGDRFSGKAYISAVCQKIEDGSWTTETALGLPDSWNVDAGGFAGESAAGLTAPIHGLQIGKVVKLDEDPGGRMRIRVRLPMVADPAPEVWARYAQPYASNGAGIQFMPEIDDEVLVAFLNADPNAPVVVGSLHNAKAPQVTTPTADNFIKAIVTREAMKLQFDEEKKIITLETPGGHKLTMDDDAQSITLNDTTGNKIVMDSSGIAITSPKDVSVKADGKVDVAATMDATVTGMNVTAEAQTAFTGKGSASAELSASGQTTVKGGIVMIN